MGRYHHRMIGRPVSSQCDGLPGSSGLQDRVGNAQRPVAVRYGNKGFAARCDGLDEVVRLAPIGSVVEIVGLGVYPLVSLGEARKAALENNGVYSMKVLTLGATDKPGRGRSRSRKLQVARWNGTRGRGLPGLLLYGGRRWSCTPSRSWRNFRWMALPVRIYTGWSHTY